MVCAQTTGKISGSVVDAENGDALPGANIIVAETGSGTAADTEGRYFIINLPPGIYALKASMIGYDNVTVKNVKVSVNRTSLIDIKMTQGVLEGETVIVVADQVDVKKDQTSTIKNISSDDIKILPVESIRQIINMQAGIVAGKFRGGRDTEVTYLIDGISVDETFDRTSTLVDIEPSSVAELEVITGTFNAEYGKAMSGVVNQITKDGTNEFQGSFSPNYGNYLTPHSDIFPGIDIPSLNQNIDYKVQLSGPIIKDKLSFFVNYRKQDNNNHLNGYHFFNPTDSSNSYSDSTHLWYLEHTGDYVPETYCSNQNGVALWDPEYLPDSLVYIQDREACESLGSEFPYQEGTCKVQYQTCTDIHGNTFPLNIGEDCGSGGVIGYDFIIKNSTTKVECEEDLTYYYTVTEPLAGYLQTIFESSENYNLRTANESYIPMNTSTSNSFMGKLSFHPFSKLRMNLMYTQNNNEWSGYSHFRKYNPFGRATGRTQSDFYSFQLNYMINNSMFFDIKLSNIKKVYSSYLFENPTDRRYISDSYSNSKSGFSLGGQDKGHLTRTTIDDNLKFDYTWQINQQHSIKTGIDFISHEIENKAYTIRDSTDADDIYTPYIFSKDRDECASEDEDCRSPYAEEYKAKPLEFSGYFQDKMEFDDMVINLGLRYDYFDPKRNYPSDYRNPADDINHPDTVYYAMADPKFQWSPRFGLAYQVGNEAILHFSYGHFFQMPPLYAMLSNYDRLIATQSFQSAIMGNPQLNAEKTITYEVGLWQKLNRLMSLEVNVYYRDIYELLSTKVFTTYNTIKYGFYTNKDYGNVRGMELKYELRSGPISIFTNYTLQYTRGNADNPAQSYSREGNNQDPVSKLIPMSWDQRHTFNTTFGYNTSSYGVSLTGYFNSGTPYTFSPLLTSTLATVNLLPNNSYKPVTYTVDMSGYYNIKILDQFSCKLTFLIYNIFDRLNEYGVNSQTGRAYTAILTESERSNFRSNFTTIEDSYQDPSAFSAPRTIKIGLELNL
jgi:outer membrane receptor for ferrienterochelin and colicin